MRMLYLIRHAQPYSMDGVSRCGCSRETPLSPAGVRQVAALRKWAQEKKIDHMYSSPMVRAVQTVQLMSDGKQPIHLRDDLREMDVGLWEGLSFDAIRSWWPQEYEQRGRHIGTAAPPGGESFVQAGERLERCIRGLLREQPGSLAVVTHGGASRGFLCRLLGYDPDRVLAVRQPWGGVTEIAVQPDGGMQVLRCGCMPQDTPTPEEIQGFLSRCGTCAAVRRHSGAVAKCVLALADRLEQPVDRKLIFCAALLHDLMRDQPNHAAAGAALLRREGYDRLATLVESHHDLLPDADTETCLLYLADKLVQEDRRVGLRARFAASGSRCVTPQARAAWQARYETVLRTAARLGLAPEELEKCE